MAATIYYDQDADLTLLNGRTVAIMGYGSQGHAHALNLRDSGVKVIVGLREGSSSSTKAEDEGLTVSTVAQAAEQADIIMMALPDTDQKAIYEESVHRICSPATPWLFRTDSTSTTPRSAHRKM